MEVLYHQTSKLVHEVQGSLGTLERAPSNDPSLIAIENEIHSRIDEILSNCERLDILVNKEPPTRRANAKLRVDQLKYDCQHLQASVRNVQNRRFLREQEEREREALLSHHFEPNDSSTSVMIDAALQHNQRLTDAHHGMDDLLSSGTSILSSLREQRMTLKGAHKKILDIANTLGLSNTVMRLIEKRASQDKIILFGGMIVTCVIMFLAWKYLT